ncbi:MAG: hypothetical protein J6T88_04055 [Bacteroidales bacterium]|nr:hypothetical protein [Bacteroidales bacterium]
MKRLVILIALVICTGTVWAQNQTLTFTSITDAKFFVYLNGKLQNERSSGMVTLKNLEDKEYHIRIVIDDPFEIAVTRTIKPDNKHNEYTVQFNAVRERVYLRQASTALKNQEGDNNLWIPQDPAPADTQATAPAKSRTSIRRDNEGDTATRRILNRIKTQTIEE